MKKYLILFLILISGVLYSQNDWQLLNPLPTHRAGGDIEFLDDNHGFILTSNELLETFDFGENWIINSTHQSAKEMDFNGNIGVILAGYSYTNNYSKYTLDGGQSWIPLSYPAIDEFKSINIFEDNTIYITSTSKLYKTSNFGEDWETISIPYNNIVKSTFINSSIGYICTSNGKIAKTVDGGNSWELQYDLPNITPNNFTSIYFFNENKGFAFRQHSSLFQTDNGGETWIETEMPFDVLSYYFINEQVGYIAGDLGRIQKTVNGGETWSNASNYDFIYGTPTYYSLYFKNTTSGIACGARGLILKTSNGTNWQPYSITYDPIKNVYLFGNIGFAHTNQNFYKTVDSGETWFTANKPSNIGIIRNIQFFNESTGIILAGSPNYDDVTKLFKTTDGGGTWDVLNDEYAQRTRIEFVNEDLGFAFNTIPSSHSQITTDGGQSFEDLDYGSNYTDFNFFNGNTGYALRGFFNNKIMKTTDGGHTWNAIYEDPQEIVDIQFFSENFGYMITDQYSRFYKTEDGGATWIELNAPPDYLKSIHFYSPSSGYLIDEENIIYHTIDGGQNWEISVSYGYTFNSPILRIINNNVIFGNDNGVIAKTTTNNMSVNDFPINSKFKIQIYPNPANDIVSFLIDKNLNINKIEIYDLNGKLISQEKTNHNNISTKNLDKGIYILKVYTRQNEIFSSKLIIK